MIGLSEMIHKNDLKVAIFYDMEGISGINDWRQVSHDQKDYEESGKILLTEDVNAAVRGLRAAGATEIGIVRAHSIRYEHLILEKLEKGVKLLGDSRTPLIDDSFTSVVLIGFHAMAGTKDGFMSHTTTLGPKVMINGKEIGETAIVAGLIISQYGIPVIMATGDQALVREASALLPKIETVQVKTSSNKETTKCLPASDTLNAIEEAAERALSRLNEFKPFQFEKPIKIDVTFPSSEYADLAEVIPRALRSDEKTVSYVTENPAEARRFEWAAIALTSPIEIGSLMTELNKIEKVKIISKRHREKRFNEWLL